LPVTRRAQDQAVPLDRLERLDGPKQDYVWAMKVDKDISRNHGDVWNGNVAAMMFALIDPKVGMMYQQAPPMSAAPARAGVVPETPPPPPAPPPPAQLQQFRPKLERQQ